LEAFFTRIGLIRSPNYIIKIITNEIQHEFSLLVSGVIGQVNSMSFFQINHFYEKRVEILLAKYFMVKLSGNLIY
jgi:hypothetical protein